jgi:hypothetical protein
MRKRKYLIGATLALAASVAFAGIAQAVLTDQVFIVSVGAKKQQKKTRGAADINITLDTIETPPTPAAQTASLVYVDFDKDFAITPGKLPTCNPTALTGTTTEAALAACGASKVGTGGATLCSAMGGCALTPGGGIQGVVTAFNGVPSGGTSLILHARFGPPANTTTVLTGVFSASPLGPTYGPRLAVTVPDTALTGLHLTHFQTAIPKLVTVKANKKKKKPAKYYVSAKCSDKTWEFRSEDMGRAGRPTNIETTTVPCKQLRPKKKKK